GPCSMCRAMTNVTATKDATTMRNVALTRPGVGASSATSVDMKVTDPLLLEGHGEPVAEATPLSVHDCRISADRGPGQPGCDLRHARLDARSPSIGRRTWPSPGCSVCVESQDGRSPLSGLRYFAGTVSALFVQYATPCSSVQ